MVTLGELCENLTEQRRDPTRTYLAAIFDLVLVLRILRDQGDPRERLEDSLFDVATHVLMDHVGASECDVSEVVHRLYPDVPELISLRSQVNDRLLRDYDRNILVSLDSEIVIESVLGWVGHITTYHEYKDVVGKIFTGFMDTAYPTSRSIEKP